MDELQLAKSIDVYHRDGFAVIPNVFTTEEINAIRAEAYLALRDSSRNPLPGFRRRNVEIRTNSQGHRFPGIFAWPALSNKYLDGIRSDARLLRIVTEILGPSTKQLNNQYYFHLPGEDDSFNWHQDIMFRHPLDKYPRIVEEDNYLQTAIIVDEFSDQVSPLFMVPGSYKLGDLRLLSKSNGRPDLESLREKPDFDLGERITGIKPKVLKAKPGDVAIWCSLTLHTSFPGPVDGFRAYYMNGFAAAHNARQWPYYSKNGKLVKLQKRRIP